MEIIIKNRILFKGIIKNRILFNNCLNKLINMGTRGFYVYGDTVMTNRL